MGSMLAYIAYMIYMDPMGIRRWLLDDSQQEWLWVQLDREGSPAMRLENGEVATRSTWMPCQSARSTTWWTPPCQRLRALRSVGCSPARSRSGSWRITTTDSFTHYSVTYSIVTRTHTQHFHTHTPFSHTTDPIQQIHTNTTLSHTAMSYMHTQLSQTTLCRTQDCHIQLSGWWFGTWILFFHILGIILPTDFHIFQRGRLNHQPAVLMYPWQAWHLVKGCLTRTPADIDTLHWGFWHIRSFPYVPYIIPHFSIILTELPMYCWLYLIVHAMSAVSPLARIEKSDEDAWIQELLRHPEWRPDQGAGKFPIMFFLLGKPRRLGLMVPQAMFAGIFIVSLWSKSNRDHPEPTG